MKKSLGIRIKDAIIKPFGYRSLTSSEYKKFTKEQKKKQKEIDKYNKSIGY